jgi:hypothetical protein
VTGHLKAGIVECEETAVARHGLGKHVPTAKDILATMEKLLEEMRAPCLIKYKKMLSKESTQFFLPRTSCV